MRSIQADLSPRPFPARAACGAVSHNLLSCVHESVTSVISYGYDRRGCSRVLWLAKVSLSPLAPMTGPVTPQEYALRCESGIAARGRPPEKSREVP
jgi:hypothetical protein